MRWTCDLVGCATWGRSLFLAAALLGIFGLRSRVEAVELRVGDVLTAGLTYFYDGQDSIEIPGILHIDPVTHEHVYLSGGGVGSGPELIFPNGIAVKGNSDVFVSDGGNILRIDPATGDRSIISGSGVGSGPALASAGSLWLREDDSLLVLDYVDKSIFAVNTATGDRSVISSPSVGSGAPFTRPNHITEMLDGRILVTSYGPTIADDEFNGFVVAIDPVTGDRSIFSDATRGSGPGYISPIGISRRHNGKILVADDWPAKIFEVDPATGVQTIIGESVPPATPVPNQFGTPRGVAEGLDGTVYFVDGDFGLMRIDANGGWASRVQGMSGPEVYESNRLAVVQVPEPGAMGLVAIGVLALGRKRLVAAGGRLNGEGISSIALVASVVRYRIDKLFRFCRNARMIGEY